MKLMHEFAEGECIVGMIEFKGRILVATNFGLYRLRDDNLEPIQLLREEPKDDGKPNRE